MGAGMVTGGPLGAGIEMGGPLGTGIDGPTYGAGCDAPMDGAIGCGDACKTDGGMASACIGIAA